MDIFSLLIFFMYALIILFILVYVSPLLSALVMIILPVFFILILPDPVRDFLSAEQFSFVVPIHNIHILLMVWSAFIGIIVYAEVLSWYLLREAKPKAAQGKPVNEPPKPGEKPKNKLVDFPMKFFNVLRGKKKE